MSDVKIYHSKDVPGFRCVSESDWATERQAREKAEAERDAKRQKVSDVDSAAILARDFFALMAGTETERKLFYILQDALDSAPNTEDVRDRILDSYAAILARHKEA